MTGVLRFPKLGSEKTLSLYEKPVQDDDETDQAFQGRLDNFRMFEGVDLTVKLVNRQTARSWGFRHDAIMARDRKRIEDQKKKGGGELVITQEALGELIELQKDILKESLVKVSGIQYGDTLLDSVTDVSALIDMLSEFDQLAPAAAAASRAQTPNPEQVKNCG